MSKETKVSTTVNGNYEGTRLTLEEAVKTIRGYSLGYIMSNWRNAASGRVEFTFDTINIKDDHLVFSQLNGTDKISFPISDITADIFTKEDESVSTTSVEFHLINGERWIAGSYGYGSMLQMYENCTEVDIDFVLKRLRGCKRVGLLYARAQISFNIYYDIVEIEDTLEDFEWGGDREVTVTLKDSSNMSSRCVMDMCDYESKFYIARDCTGFTSLYVGLHDTTFTKIRMTILDSNESSPQ